MTRNRTRWLQGEAIRLARWGHYANAASICGRLGGGRHPAAPGLGTVFREMPVQALVEIACEAVWARRFMLAQAVLDLAFDRSCCV